MNSGHLGRELHVVGVELCPLSKMDAPSCYVYFPYITVPVYTLMIFSSFWDFVRRLYTYWGQSRTVTLNIEKNVCTRGLVVLG